MRIRLSLASLALAALLGAGCSNPEDQAAKRRIFSPEDPPKTLQAAQERLEPASLHERPALVERIVSISASEAAFRIGGHVQSASTTFRWKGADKTVSLQETRKVAVDPGGDFHVLVENDERQGMEWIRVGGVSYSRSRYAKFRERRRDRGSSHHVLEDSYTTLQTFHQLVHGALALTPAGEQKVEGRKALAYTVSLGKPWERADDGLPPLEFPAGGPDEDTRLRLQAAEKGRATSVQGKLVVDAETGVPLLADLEATVEVPDEAGVSTLKVATKVTVGTIGGKLGIAVPDHLDDAPRPPGAVSVLKAYGLRAEQEEAADAPSE